MKKVIRAEIEIAIDSPTKSDRFFIREVKKNLDGLEIYLDLNYGLYCENLGTVKVRKIEIKGAGDNKFVGLA